MQIDVYREDTIIKAVTYVAKKQYVDDRLKPYTWYKQFVVRGAVEHGLPGKYVAAIEAVEAIKDPGLARAEANRKILEGGRSKV